MSNKKKTVLHPEETLQGLPPHSEHEMFQLMKTKSIFLSLITPHTHNLLGVEVSDVGLKGVI